MILSRTPAAGLPPAVFLAVVLLAAEAPAEPLDGPLPSMNAPRAFQLEPGLRIELVAAEPLIVAPVAMAFDERGRLFVAENRGYPNGAKEGEPPLGRIALLEDTDRNGTMDKRQEFVTGLTFPNGVLPWEGGLIVTCAPDILFFKDTDGDGQADERKVLFTGFATTGSTQLRTSHPTLSLDGWIYVTSGLTGGKVTCPNPPVANAQGSRNPPPVELKRTDFRFRPDLSAYEAADGGGQFGLSLDDFGRRFICYNRVQVQHVVLSSQLLRRNPHLAFSETVENCPADLAPEPLAGHGRAARLYPISQNVTTADSHAGTFTAACGVHIFRGTGLPEQFRGAAFSCDPTGNLIHVDRLVPKGATFSAEPMLPNRELLASSDNWFRPVFLTSGPDGALYVCDMYRKTIEHPDYLPVEIRKRTDFESGRDMGRIWRISRDGPVAREESLAGKSSDYLVALLTSTNGWTRDTAHRLLAAEKNLDSVVSLRRLANNRFAHAVGSVHAMHLLNLLGELDDETLRNALGRESPEVRECALELLLPRIAKRPDWIELIKAAAAQPGEGRVVLNAILCYGAVPIDEDLREPGSGIPRYLASAMGTPQASGDKWLRAAVFSGLAGREFAFANEVLTQSAKRRYSPDFLRELGTLWVASQEPDSFRIIVRQAVLRDGVTSDVLFPLLTGIGEGLRRRGVAPGERGLLHATLPEDDAAHGRLDECFAEAATLAQAGDRPAEVRIAALGLLSFGKPEGAAKLLTTLLDPSVPADVQRAAVRNLGGMQDAARVLLEPERFASYSPALREEALAVIIAQPAATAALLDALEGQKLPVAAIDALRRRQLREHRDLALRARAAKLFEAVVGDRMKVYEELKGVADLPGDATKGKLAFEKHCASCHRLDRVGFAVGPDLFGIRNQPKAAILLHILVPEQEITQGFTAYTAETKDGRVITGLLAGETEQSVTIRQPLGKQETIQRADLERLTASPLSLMPQGLEKTLSRQDLADLLAYLKGEK